MLMMSARDDAIEIVTRMIAIGEVDMWRIVLSIDRDDARERRWDWGYASFNIDLRNSNSGMPALRKQSRAMKHENTTHISPALTSSQL